MTCDGPSVWKAIILLTCKIAFISALGVILAALSANTYADDMVVNACLLYTSPSPRDDR